jgi:hypothetical protein
MNASPNAPSRAVRRLSQATMRNIRQNLFLAFIYNAAGVPVAAGVLYPFLGILLIAHHRGCHDGALVSERDRQRHSPQGRRAARPPVNQCRRSALNLREITGRKHT